MLLSKLKYSVLKNNSVIHLKKNTNMKFRTVRVCKKLEEAMQNLKMNQS